MNLEQFIEWLGDNNVCFQSLKSSRYSSWLLIEPEELITLPDNLDLENVLLHISHENSTCEIPKSLKCGNLTLHDSTVSEIPDCLRVRELNIVGSEVTGVPQECAEVVITRVENLTNQSGPDDAWIPIIHNGPIINPIKTFYRSL